MTALTRLDGRPREPAYEGGGRTSPILVIGILALALGLLLGSAVAGQPVLALAATTVVLLGIAAVARPDVATLVVFFILYSNAAVVAVTIHGAPFIVGASLPVLLLAPLAYHLLMRREPVVVTPALPFILAYFFVLLLSAFASADPRSASVEVAVFVSEGIGLYLLVTNTVRSPEMLRRVVWTLLLVGAFLGSVSTIQQLTGTADNHYFGFGQTDSSFGTGEETLAGEIRQPRLAGPIGEQNRYAQVMLMLVPLGLFQLFAERRSLLRALIAGATLLTALGSTLAFSRGAFVGFALLVVIMAAMRYIRLRQLLAVGLGIILVALVVPQIGSRLGSLNPLVGLFSDEAEVLGSADNSVQSRVTENIAALLVFADHPWLGVGPGQFPVYYRDYAADVGILVKPEDREAHNLYLGVAAEVGIFGFLAFMGAITVTLLELARARRRWLRDRPALALTATGFSLALVTYLTTGLFLHLSYARYFWFILALAGAAAFVALREAERVEDVRSRPLARRTATGRPRTNRVPA